MGKGRLAAVGRGRALRRKSRPGAPESGLQAPPHLPCRSNAHSPSKPAPLASRFGRPATNGRCRPWRRADVLAEGNGLHRNHQDPGRASRPGARGSPSRTAPPTRAEPAGDRQPAGGQAVRWPNTSRSATTRLGAQARCTRCSLHPRWTDPVGPAGGCCICVDLPLGDPLPGLSPR